MESTYVDQGYTLLNPTRPQMRFADNFLGKLCEFYITKDLAPSMVVTVVAADSFQGRTTPASMLRHVAWEQGYEMSNDAKIVASAVAHITDGRIRLPPTERIAVGGLQRQCTESRIHKPPRFGTEDWVPIYKAFNQGGFHYGRDNVDAAVFQRLPLDGCVADAVMNRYPFAPYHGLIVPKRKEGNHAQHIDPKNSEDRSMLEALWSFVREMGEGANVGYNSLGAHASVNHLHFQVFLDTKSWQLPLRERLKNEDIVSSRTLKDAYLPGTRWISATDGVEGLCAAIEEMNARAETDGARYNFWMTSQGIAFFPRVHQGDERYVTALKKAGGTTGFAFAEPLGEIVSSTNTVDDEGQYLKEVHKVFRTMSLERRIGKELRRAA